MVELDMRIGSLFSGIGGLELGLEMAGLGETVWQVEREPFCRIVLAKHWPHTERFDDVCSVGSANLAAVDLICGGFPCQDVSSSGPRIGLAGSRSGLWREYARIVRELRPAWCVVENVTSGATQWVDAVVGELDALGYACLPCPVSARDVGAPHRRERIFVVAHHVDEPDAVQSAARQGLSGLAADAHSEPSEPGRSTGERDEAPQPVPGRGAEDDRPAVCPGCCGALIDQGLCRRGELCPTCSDPLFAPDADNARRERPGPSEQAQGRQRFARHAGWSPQPGLVPLVHGLSGGMAGRRRRARIRALGNAVMPQCAEVAGWVIRELLARSSSPRSGQHGSSR